MITLYSYKEIKETDIITETLKKEIKAYFREIAKGIVGDGWQGYNLSEVGAIVIIEKGDTIEVLDSFGLMQGSNSTPEVLPEFATKVKVEDTEMIKIIWVTGDSFGVSVYYTIGQFGREFDEYIMKFLMD
ncbi:hypothetical protein [Clostridium sp. YIM B02551]|uniref:hypothetical protein n=1 Tax=Clostridium sp. YIM B02551 TaxID=2910679 RepID=UPI001EEC3ABB|nr:hypothetical protein [Clostridium sp. YIM B02551]